MSRRCITTSALRPGPERARRWPIRRRAAKLLSVVLVLVGGATLAFGQDQARVIHACVGKGLLNQGAVRIVSEPGQCRSNETPLTWNQTGQQGPAGAPGPVGAPGPKGDPAALPPSEPWRVLPFASGWADLGSVFVAGQFRKDPLGRVHVRGLVSKATGIPVSDDLIATLPSGYRPSARQVFGVATCCGDAPGRVDVLPDGSIVRIAGASGERDATSLDTISFWTD